jgi:hypothetical protein
VAVFVLVPNHLLQMLAQLAAYFNAKGTGLENIVQNANGWQFISSLTVRPGATGYPTWHGLGPCIRCITTSICMTCN